MSTIETNPLGRARPWRPCLRIPLNVLIATVVLAMAMTVAVLHVRGVGDPEGYPLNTTQFIKLNTYEDDGLIVLFSALDYYKDDSLWFSRLFNFGGPFIHASRALVWIGDKVGVVKRFDDPSMYLVYPNELIRLWKLVCLFNTSLSIWCPILLYWIGANFIDKRAGMISAWLMAATPFAIGFAPRLKVDLPTIVLGLVSIFFQLAYVRSARRAHLYGSGFFLGLSISVKLSMLPAAGTMVLSHALVARRSQASRAEPFQWTAFAKACVVAVAVFVAANPLILKGMSGVFNTYAGVITHDAGSASGVSLAQAVWYRLTHFSSFFGSPLNVLVLPTLVFSLGSWFIRSFPWRRTIALLTALFVLDFAFITLAVQSRMVNLTYYFYPHAVVLLLLIAAMLSWLVGLARGVLLKGVVLAVPILLVAAGLAQDARVLEYMVSKTNRQNSLAWIHHNIPEGSSIGLPAPEGTEYFSTNRRLDPFRYTLVPVGPSLESLDSKKPDYALWIGSSPENPAPEIKGYALAALFDSGKNLPHERYDLYQEEVFVVYRREELSDKPTAPFPIEAALGDFFRKDDSGAFNILQRNVLHFYPISLNLVRKTSETILPFPSEPLFESVRSWESPLAYTHQTDPNTLTLWGVRYLLMKADDPELRESKLCPPVYNFARKAGFTTESQVETLLLANGKYAGQAMFLPDRAPVVDAREQHKFLFFGLRPLKPFGRLLPLDRVRNSGIKSLEVVFVLETDATVDLILKGGPVRQSLLVPSGQHTVRATYYIENATEDIGYEINSLSPGVTISLKQITARELEIQDIATHTTTDFYNCFTSLETKGPGRVTFALPYHRYWRAEVNGRPAPVEPGPAGVVAVHIPEGRNFISLVFERP